MNLRWIDHDGRECVARFKTDAEAQACAEGLHGVQDVHLLDDDGEPLPYKETHP